MRSAVAIALLAAGTQAHPMIAHIKRSMQGHGGDAPQGNSGYSATPAAGLKDTCLQAHNDARGAYGYPLLEWDDSLASSAQGWAEQIGGNLDHSRASGYGENLAFNSNGNARDMILNQWFGECPQYGGGFSEGAGHYSQCIWKATTHVGCGMNSDNMLVCQYYPAGNVEGEYDQNVPSPGQCVNNIGGLQPGSGGSAPTNNGPGYSGTGATGSGSNYGGSKATGSTGNYGGSSPSNTGSYGDNSGSSPSHGGHHDKPKPTPEQPCDEEGSSPKPHGGSYGDKGSSPVGSYGDQGSSPVGSYKAPSDNYGSHGQSGSDSDNSYGGHSGQSASDNGSYGSSDDSGSHSGGYGDSGSSGQSGSHGGSSDDDCEE